jgi:hypothetical protein
LRQDLTGCGRRDDPGGDMHIDAADVVVAELNLAGVQARANLQADPCEFAA